MECILPLGLAWLLRHRSKTQRQHQQLCHHQNPVHRRQNEGNAPLCDAHCSATGGLPLREQMGEERSHAVADATLVSEAEHLQRMLLQLCLLQLAMRSGLWERAFNFMAVKVIRRAHKTATRVLKALLTPVIRCGRPSARATAANAIVPNPVEEAQVTTSDASPQSALDMEEPTASHRMTQPSNIIIISRPCLGAAAASSNALRSHRRTLTLPPSFEEIMVASCSAPGPSQQQGMSAAAAQPFGRDSTGSQHCHTTACGSSEIQCAEGREAVSGERGNDANIDDHAVQSSSVGQSLLASGPSTPQCPRIVGSIASGLSTVAATEKNSVSGSKLCQPSEPGLEQCITSRDKGTSVSGSVDASLQASPPHEGIPESATKMDEAAGALGPLDADSGALAVIAPPTCSQDPSVSAVVLRVLELPLCVAVELLSRLDTDAKHVLRRVSRGLYFETSRHIHHLTVQHDNLEKLIYMPMHHVFPYLTSLTFRAGPPSSQQLGQLGEQQQQQQQSSSPVLPALKPSLLSRLLTFGLPHLRYLSTIDISEASLHTNVLLWESFVHGLPKDHPVLVRMREPTTWWARGLTTGLPGDSDPYDHFPALLDALKVLQRAAPLATVDLQGITVRKHTSSRIPQLCNLTCLRHLSLFGKSAVAVPHGHRLASHLRSFANMANLVSLELLSYEDVSDNELAVLAGCPSLRHLYIDSLFIKMASGPSFPNITSLTAARIKFILQPLTTIFPNLLRLRLGVLHSELNKKINSASMSCLAGCSESLKELVVCPVLWKGQWQVLPTLTGLRYLSLVHCKDLSHLREVMKVVGRFQFLEVLELQACSSSVAPWPGMVASEPVVPAAGPAAAGEAQPHAAENAAAGGLIGAVVAAAENAAAAGGDASGSDTQLLGPLSEATNLFSGLSTCSSLRQLIIHDCAPVLVRHLAAVNLPGLRSLYLEKLGPGLRLPEVQAAALNFQGLGSLHIHNCPSITAAQAEQLPSTLTRSWLVVDWRSSCQRPSLYTTRGFGTAGPKA